MSLTIQKDRARLLEENFFEYSFDDREPDQQLFNQITNPAELHFIADLYNWDDGTEVLEWIVDSDLCDEGTAKLIFWRAEPQDFTSCESVVDVGFMGEDVYKLLRKIIRNFEDGIYKKATIAYDPAMDVDLNYKNPKEKWAIPEYLKQPTKGQSIVLVG
ncbi:MAG: DUF4274 domain-containing protein [Bacteroidota bacterium]